MERSHVRSRWYCKQLTHSDNNPSSNKPRYLICRHECIWKCHLQYFYFKNTSKSTYVDLPWGLQFFRVEQESKYAPNDFSSSNLLVEEAIPNIGHHQKLFNSKWFLLHCLWFFILVIFFIVTIFIKLSFLLIRPFTINKGCTPMSIAIDLAISKLVAKPSLMYFWEYEMAPSIFLRVTSMHKNLDCNFLLTMSIRHAK